MTLVAEHLRKEFGRVVAVRDVSFTIEAGATLGLIGPNGAGKTTTMRMLLGILVLDAGRLQWRGEDVDSRTRHRFGYLPEERGLYGRMDVREHVEYFGRLHGMNGERARRAAARWIARLELGVYAERPCAELSKGNQQKVQIACAAVHSPELLVLDEPFSGLDPVNADILAGIVRALRDEGTTLVLSSHQMWQLEQLCTHYCIVDGGESRAGGTLAQLRARVPVRVVRVAPSLPAMRAVLAALDGARDLASSDEELVFEVPAGTSVALVVERLAAAGPIARFELAEPSLRDVYLQTVGETA